MLHTVLSRPTLIVAHMSVVKCCNQKKLGPINMGFFQED